MIVEDQSALITFLSRPGTYGPGVMSVERIDTHCAVVFLAGAYAYKLKRAVRFPYLDFSTAELRRKVCRAELRINRRTAPDLYRRVIPATRRHDGPLELDGDGEPVDWLLVMARFDQDTLFDRMAMDGKLTPALMAELADEIAAFHDGAPRRPEHGGRKGIAFVVESNAEAFAECDPGILAPGDAGRLTAESRAALDRLGPHLEARRAMGRVRRCHGDLHLRNIVLMDGRPTLFDAIEFSERLACIDVLYDVAFLIMDLVHRSLGGLANAALNRYLDHTGDLSGLGALPLFLSVRAAVRAHVSAISAMSVEPGRTRDELAAEAGAYLTLAAAQLSPPPPRMLAVGGLSGSGKSTLDRARAPEIGAAPGAIVLRSDVLRKELMAVAPLVRLPQSAYRPEITERVYATLRNRARTVLAAGHGVVVDAVHSTPEERQALAAVARAVGARFDGLWLDAPADAMAARIAGRRADASDSTVAVMRQQIGYDLGTISWPRVEAGGDAAASLQAARAALED